MELQHMFSNADIRCLQCLQPLAFQQIVTTGIPILNICHTWEFSILQFIL